MDESQAQAFREEIGMLPNPEKDAKEALQAYQRQMGIVIEDPDAPVAPDAKAMAAADEEQMSEWMGGPRRG